MAGSPAPVRAPRRSCSYLLFAPSLFLGPGVAVEHKRVAAGNTPRQVRQVMKEDDLSVSELLRQGIRLFMEEREWRRRERLERLRSRQNDQE